MKYVVLLMYLLTISVAYAEVSDEITSYLQEHRQTPEEYVLSKARTHKITIIGEGHWLKQDVDFVAGLIPALHKAEIDLAVEIFPASQQAAIDKLIAAPSWSVADANAVMRAASWPYIEYRDLLRSAWRVNRDSEKRIRILAVGPPADWRTSLVPKGDTYDSFMADLVIKHLAQQSRSVMVYAGMHHAFTRYYQAELSMAGVATAYMDRMGNILARALGNQVFLVALHKPIWCGNPAELSYCLPFAGQIDCVASKIGQPIGFDVVNSPLSQLPFEPTDYYSYGHNALRFVDYTDGYIWFGGIESFKPVTVIELDEFAPNERSFRALMKSNPFTGEQNVTQQRLRDIWVEEVQANQDFLAKRKWKHLSAVGCDEPEKSDQP